MRLYKQKNILKQHLNTPDCLPSLSPTPPATPSPYQLKRAADAVSKQISIHKSMLAQFKELKMPRTPVFSTKLVNPQPTSRPLPPNLSKAVKASGRLPIAPTKAHVPRVQNSVLGPKQHVLPARTSTKPQTPARAPGQSSEKAIPAVKKAPTPNATANRPQSFSSPSRPLPSKAGSKSTTPLSQRGGSTRAKVGSSVTCTPKPKTVDLDQPILSVSCFQSVVDDPALKAKLTENVKLTSEFEVQVTQAFEAGLGPITGNEVARYGEIAAPSIIPGVVTIVSTLEPMPMSALVEWYEPVIDTELAFESLAQVEVDEFETTALAQNHMTCVASTRASGAQDVSLFPYQPPSSTDYEYVAYLGKGSFGAVALGIHKRDRRQCAVKIICKAIVEEKNLVHAVLVEQRVMREASGYPFLLGLLASFHDVHNFYLVSEYCRSTLFDERLFMLDSEKKLVSAELACAVDHLHSLGIIHRDIKLENVMMKDDGHIVLGDFGLACILEAPKSLALGPGELAQVDRSSLPKPVTRGVCGTLPYMAPEVLCDMEYSYSADLFAYGVFLHAFYYNKFPWLGEHENPASYLKEMVSTMSEGLTFQDGPFGDLLNKLFCLDQDARADLSVVRRATFFADIDWQNVNTMGLSPSYLPHKPGPRVRRMLDSDGGAPPIIKEVPRYAIGTDPCPNFTWVNPSTIVKKSTPDVSDTYKSFDSNTAELYPSFYVEASPSDRSPVCCGVLQVTNSFMSSILSQKSSYESVAEDYTDVLRSSARALDEGEDPIYTFPPEWVAAFGDSGICLGKGTATMPTFEDDESLVRMTIRSLDVGEEPVFELPSGWNDSFVSSPDVKPPSLSEPESARKTSVLPRLKSLWKRAASKIVSWQV